MHFGANSAPTWEPDLSQNGAKLPPKSLKIRSWRALGGVLEGLGGQDRKKMRVGTRFFGGLLGPSWHPPGAVLGPSWPPKGSQDGPKIDRKIDEKNEASWYRFLEGFWWVWEPKLASQIDQNRRKIDAKMSYQVDLIF